MIKAWKHKNNIVEVIKTAVHCCKYGCAAFDTTVSSDYHLKDVDCRPKQGVSTNSAILPGCQQSSLIIIIWVMKQ